CDECGCVRSPRRSISSGALLPCPVARLGFHLLCGASRPPRRRSNTSRSGLRFPPARLRRRDTAAVAPEPAAARAPAPVGRPDLRASLFFSHGGLFDREHFVGIKRWVQLFGALQRFTYAFGVDDRDRAVFEVRVLQERPRRRTAPFTFRFARLTTGLGA